MTGTRGHAHLAIFAGEVVGLERAELFPRGAGLRAFAECREHAE
jgi:hypothetical protein